MLLHGAPVSRGGSLPLDQAKRGPYCRAPGGGQGRACGTGMFLYWGRRCY